MSQTQQLHSEHTPSAWPEGQDIQRQTVEPFPWRSLLLWLVPGIIGSLLLVAGYFLLEQRAAKQVVYVTGAGQLGMVRADGAQVRVLKEGILEDLRFSQPQWSPNGQQFAAVGKDEKNANLVLLSGTGILTQTIPLSTTDAVPLRNAWSADGTYFTLITFNARSTFVPSLAIVHSVQHSVQVVTRTLVLDAPISWHPTRSELLITSITENLTPTLQIITTDGQMRPLASANSQSAQHSGVWSPDGSQIAYVEPNTLVSSNRTRALGAGTIWVAGEDGANARQLVANGLNSAPVWAPSGEYIFFTHEVTETQSFDLYRVSISSQEIVRVGNGLDSSIFGNQQILNWSPDGTKMYFVSGKPNDSTLYVAQADGNNAEAIATSQTGVLFAQWAPTNRSILIANPSKNNMLLQPIGTTVLQPITNAQPVTFPAGSTPDWQP